MLLIQEITFYNDLVKKGIVPKINCPFDIDDIVVTKVNSKDEIYFECITCDTNFYPSIRIVNTIRTIVDKFKHNI